jgi:hypothetical protein
MPLELPPYFDYLLPEDAPLPACNSATDVKVDVTLITTLNGYVSTDRPTFDNCTYQQAIANSTGPAALAFTANFPEDSTAPETTIRTIPSGPVSGVHTAGFWTVELSCEDPVFADFAAGCAASEYSLDGAGFALYVDEVKITQHGLHTFEYRSIDAAGNVEDVRSVSLGVLTELDTTPPVTTLTALPSVSPYAGWTSGTWTVGLSCDDPGEGDAASGCQLTEYSLDFGPFVPFEGEFVISEIGGHTVEYRSTDAMGNIEASKSEFLGVDADSDGDTVPDVQDNCTEIANFPQLDTDTDGCGNACDADFDNNNFVNFADLALFRAAFGTQDEEADLDGSGGTVNFADLAIFRSLFGKPPGPPGPDD